MGLLKIWRNILKYTLKRITKITQSIQILILIEGSLLSGVLKKILEMISNQLKNFSLGMEHTLFVLI